MPAVLSQQLRRRETLGGLQPIYLLPCSAKPAYWRTQWTLVVATGCGSSAVLRMRNKSITGVVWLPKPEQMKMTLALSCTG